MQTLIDGVTVTTFLLCGNFISNNEYSIVSALLLRKSREDYFLARMLGCADADIALGHSLKL